MEDLAVRIECAKHNKSELNALIADYMPFIKKEAAKVTTQQLEYDDKLSVAMLVFMNCVSQYHAGKGSFIAFAGVCIRNRLIDENKRSFNYAKKIVPLYTTRPDGMDAANEISATLEQYDKQLEQVELSDEINRLSEHLKNFDITFSQLTKICPKQNRSRKQCIAIAQAICADEKMKERLFRYKRLSQADLAKKFRISVKTIEKYRKYIVCVVVILSGNYQGIQAFLPGLEEVQA